MKICPTCKRTYTDAGLNFCLDDGTVLTVAGSDLPETVMMNAPPTNPAGAAPTSTQPGPFGTPQTSPQTWQQPQFSMQPPVKKRRTGLWILGIAALGLLLCGGGAVLFVGLAIYNAPADDVRSGPTPAEKSPTPAPTGSPFGGTTKIDLSGWVSESPYGTTSYSAGEFMMGSKQKDYYYVLVAGEEFQSDSATVRVTLRNTENASSNLGYGIVFHSKQVPLQQGYAFLIDTKLKRYRVVRHQPGKELSVKAWTSSDAVNPGTEPNRLEVRHKRNTNELFINDRSVATIPNTYGFKGGVVGLYTGDGLKIGFKDLEIVK